MGLLEKCGNEIQQALEQFLKKEIDVSITIIQPRQPVGSQAELDNFSKGEKNVKSLLH